MIHILRINIHFKMQNALKYFNSSEKVLRLKVEVTKVKVENFHSWLTSHITKQLLTSISVDMMTYLP